MLALCLMLSKTYYVQDYAGIVGLGLCTVQLVKFNKTTIQWFHVFVRAHICFGWSKSVKRELELWTRLDKIARFNTVAIQVPILESSLLLGWGQLLASQPRFKFQLLCARGLNHVDSSKNHLDSLLESGNQVEILESGIMISTFILR